MPDMETPPPASPEPTPPSVPTPPPPTPPETPPPAPPTPPPASTAPVPLPPSSPEEKQWKVIMHLSALCAFVVPAGNIIAPLVIWLVKKPELPGLDPEAKKILNFQISYTIYMIIALVAFAVASCLIIPLILPLVVGIPWIIFTIIGGVKASNNEPYEFPLTIKML